MKKHQKIDLSRTFTVPWVSEATVHASNDPRLTSIGPGAIGTFMRAMCYDRVPDGRLPLALQDANPLGLKRKVNGIWTREPIPSA